MTCSDIVERIKASKLWRESGIVTAPKVRTLCGHDIDRKQAMNAIQSLVTAGEAVRVGCGMYQRKPDNTWLKKRWRTLSNEDLGIYPERLGLL